MPPPVYLDYNATTPVDEQVLAEMLPWFGEHFGNPSSRRHAYGWTADEAVKKAREQIAELVGAEPAGVTFTGSATEALNLAIKGVAQARKSHGRHLVTVSTEHNAVLGAHEALEREGFEITRLPVDASGLVESGDVAQALRSDTILLSVMWANNETGVIQPIEELYEIARRHNVIFLTDVTQAAGKVRVHAGAADLLACSAHKMYGPKGVGALIRNPASRRLRIIPQIHGGGHEDGLRAGTLNVPGIVGMGAAAELVARSMEDDADRLSKLRDNLENQLRAVYPHTIVNGINAPRLPQTSSIAFAGTPAEKMLPLMRDVAVSTGSACASGSGRISHVLQAMGLSDELARSTMRLSLGRSTTPEEVDRAVSSITKALQSLGAAQIA